MIRELRIAGQARSVQVRRDDAALHRAVDAVARAVARAADHLGQRLRRRAENRSAAVVFEARQSFRAARAVEAGIPPRRWSACPAATSSRRAARRRRPAHPTTSRTNAPAPESPRRSPAPARPVPPPPADRDSGSGAWSPIAARSPPPRRACTGPSSTGTGSASVISTISASKPRSRNRCRNTTELPPSPYVPITSGSTSPIRTVDSATGLPSRPARMFGSAAGTRCSSRPPRRVPAGRT